MTSKYKLRVDPGSGFIEDWYFVILRDDMKLPVVTIHNTLGQEFAEEILSLLNR